MASIQRIVSPLTKAVSYRAQVRVRGRPALSETFPSVKEAGAWAGSTESAIREGRHFPHLKSKRTHAIRRFWCRRYPATQIMKEILTALNRA